MATSPQLPTQVSPPEFALSPALPHQIGGAEVWAFPVVADPAVLPFTRLRDGLRLRPGDNRRTAGGRL